MSEGVEARLKAVQALMPVVQQKTSLTSSLPKMQQRLSSEDASLTQALAFGVCRFYTRLNFLAEHLLERPFKSQDLDVHLLLLIGLYQLQEERVADYAAIFDRQITRQQPRHSAELRPRRRRADCWQAPLRSSAEVPACPRPWIAGD